MVHVLAPAAFGGLESVVEILASGQVRAGDDVRVVLVLPTAGDKHRLEATLPSLGVSVVRLALPVRAYQKERRAVRAILRDTKADILHTHGYRPDVIDGPVARGLRLRTVSTVHGFMGGGAKNRAYEWIQRRALRRFHAVVAVSDDLKQDLLRSGISPGRVHTIQNAWEGCDPLPRSQARELLRIGAHESVVGWVGRMSPEKAPDVAIRAFAALPWRDVHLSMIGAGPEEGRCRALAHSLGLGDRVRFHGIIEGAGAVFSAFDMLVVSSWTEGTPMVVLEAMWAGIPIVTTAVGGIPQVVSGREAILVEAGDPGALAHGIDMTLRDGESAFDRAARARARLARDFSVAPWVEKHRALYASLRG